ncbi:MAG TPA: hypothetical protein VE775_05585, partial [Pyrinomonadaceae bacterium]|nr:hypothetical protein [Pyrinomonadaceae bacterium]
MLHKLIRLTLLLTICGAQLAPAWAAPAPRVASKHAHAYVRPRAASTRSRPLWPGARFTAADRARAIRRGLSFIYRTARVPANFASYGGDYVWCFYTLSAAVDDPAVRRTARLMGRERARVWRKAHRTLPPEPDAATISEYVYGSDAADSLGVRDDAMKRVLARVASRFTARDYLRFDPRVEPPPVDVPDECEYDGTENARGAKFCRVCQRPLVMKTRYDVWYDALITAYVGDRYGVPLGAHYADVLRWLPTLRPYPDRAHAHGLEFYDAIYAIAHVVYTLNHYNQAQLAPQLLPAEYEFLHAHIGDAVALKEADMLGEMMDSLRAFGVGEDDPALRAAIEFYLARQNPDGSWGDMNA